MKLVSTVRKIRACEGEVAAQLVMENLIKQEVKKERVKIHEAINEQIKAGNIGGDGTDKTAERNGLIMASNIVFNFGI